MLQEIISKVAEYKVVARIKTNAHYYLAHKGTRRNRYFGIAVTIISSIVGTTIFATLSNANGKYLQILTGCLSVLAAVLSALQTFLAFSEFAEKHKKGALAYEAVCNKADYFLLLYPKSGANEAGLETNALGGFKEISTLMEKASQEAPTIPNAVYNMFKRKQL